MTTLSQAVEMTKGLGKQYKAVLMVAEALEGVSNLEQTKTELVKVVDEARKETSKVQTRLKNAKEKLQTYVMDIEVAVAEAKDARSQAQQVANKLINDAHQNADNIVSDAIAKVHEIDNTAKEAEVEHKMVMKAWEEEERKLIERIATHRSEMAALKERLDA